jgi:hypothetical protein
MKKGNCGLPATAGLALNRQVTFETAFFPAKT